MAFYGAKKIRFAPITADTDESKYPTYDKAASLGALVAVTDAISYAEANNYGDNELQETASEFQSLTVDVEVTELPSEQAAVVYGATLTEDGDLEYGGEDDAPWGGLAFYTNKQVKKDGVQKKFYQGVFYPKVKGSRQGATYNTKGQSITFANGKAHFVGTTCAKGKHQVFSKNFETEAEAEAWCAKWFTTT